MTSKLLNTIVLGAAIAAVVAYPAAEARAAEKELVSYRALRWQTIEFDDAAKAKVHVETLKKIGCEVKEEPHAGHIDVSYRCPEWRQMSLKSHEDAHNWERWLKATGFETKHEH